jgi:hypothetical protein
VHAEFGGRLPGKGRYLRIPDLAGQPTLPAKHHGTVSEMAARYKAKVKTRNGPRTCFEARRKREGKKDLVARSGGIILQRDRHAVIRDPRPAPAAYPRKELISRL